MATDRGIGQRVLDRLVGAALALLATATAVYVAVRLIESIAATFIIIVAVIGGLLLLGLLSSALLRRRRANRW